MDWPMYRHVERQASRTNELLQKLDVDAVKLMRLGQGEAFSEARKRCLKCIRAQECLDWLDASAPPAGDPDFCPNLSLYLSCKKT